jgi:hypothetical protein
MDVAATGAAMDVAATGAPTAGGLLAPLVGVPPVSGASTGALLIV